LIGRTCVGVLVGLVLLAGCLSGPEKAVEQAAPTRPNIVFMVVEDLSPRIGAFGDTLAQTPNLDKLAREGVRYTQVFATAGVCAPSRAALITGMHQSSIGAQHMRTSSFVWEGGARKGYEAVPPPSVKAFPELLRAAGYFAVNNAKTDYQFGNPFTVWDENGPNATWANRAEGQPFFAMYSQQVTHESALFTEAYLNDAANIAGDIRGLVRTYESRRAALPHRTRPQDVIVPLYYPDTPEVRADIARQYDNVALMDAWVGERMEELRMAGVLDNTIVIWTTDHGDGLPRAKRTLFDSGLRVPMIIRFPDGRGAGTSDDRMISFIDLAPTLLGLAGARAPETLQGTDFLRKEFKGRAHVFAGRDRFDEIYLDKQRAVRSRDFKYIRNDRQDVQFYGDVPFRDNIATMRELRRRNADGTLTPLQGSYFAVPRPPEELYDLRTDPDEIRNLADDPRFARQKRRMIQALDRWQAEAPDWSDQPERQMVETRMWPGGVQPATAAPSILYDGGRVQLSSATEGASIGYRFAGDPVGWWRLYTGPFAAPLGASIEAKAIRYGFKESPVISGGPWAPDVPR
jgi:N-sulfoglucosamine sulfohydrolase